jgi:Zn-finger nucleic acid-binding protein
MQCPKCNSGELAKARSASTGVTVDHCAQCRGMWCDRAELERMLNVVVRDLDVPRRAELSTKKCPSCGIRLHAYPYRGTLVTVDACPKCLGIWLDGGELQRLRERRGFIKKDVGTARNTSQHSRPSPDEAPPPKAPRPKGAKNTLISMINEAIDNLSKF